MAFRQPSRDIAMRIRLLLLLVSKITHIFFSFLLRARYVYFLSSLGSSVIGLPFPPLGCLSVIFVDVTCAMSWLHRRVQRPTCNSWCRVQILLPIMWSQILCSLSSSIAVADGLVLVACHVSRSLLIVVAEGRDF